MAGDREVAFEAEAPAGREPGTGPLLSLAGIVKQFPGCRANDGIDLEIAEHEIHALLGENGAGKSTLVKILYGVLRADEGEIRWRGRPVAFSSPAAARERGIGMVFQHFSLFDSLTVAENIALGLDQPESRRGLGNRIAEISARYGLPLDPHRVVHDLSVGERQRIEIMRCLLQNPKLLIMDEPTSVLTPQEVERLFATLRRLAAEGCAILYISHKLEEVRALCSRATILRLGRVVGRCAPAEKSARELAEMMINARLQPQNFAHRAAREQPARLEIAGLSQRSAHTFGTTLTDISLRVAGGEIVGIAGIAGNGQAELMETLTGEQLSPQAETIRLDGAAVGRLGPRERRRRGGAFLPEERNGHGAVGTMSLAENAYLSGAVRKGLQRLGFVDRGRTREFALEIIAGFDVRTTGPDAEARALSGGNLQKFLVGREVLQNPGILVLNQPTWGVDAGAAAAIYTAIAALARAGAAVLVISQDLDEILMLCDRIAVLAAGRLSAPMPVGEATIEHIGLLMGGSAAPSPARDAQAAQGGTAR